MNALSSVSSELRTAARRYQPTSMVDAGYDLAHLYEVAEDFAAAIKTLTTRATASWPLHPEVIKLLAATHTAQIRIAEGLQEVGPAFRSHHAADLARHENPRRGEGMWNVPPTTR